MSTIERRLAALEKAANAEQESSHISQAVIYDLITGKPLIAPDPMAARQIWIPDDGRGLQRPQR